MLKCRVELPQYRFYADWVWEGSDRVFWRIIRFSDKQLNYERRTSLQVYSVDERFAKMFLDALETRLRLLVPKCDLAVLRVNDLDLVVVNRMFGEPYLVYRVQYHWNGNENWLHGYRLDAFELRFAKGLDYELVNSVLEAFGGIENGKPVASSRVSFFWRVGSWIDGIRSLKRLWSRLFAR